MERKQRESVPLYIMLLLLLCHMTACGSTSGPSVVTGRKETPASVTAQPYAAEDEAVSSEPENRTAWTIGDSIFDFHDNFETDMVQSILTDSGYTSFFMDNIAGATVRAASGVGIVDHIESGMYEEWEEPDLILLYRGTNDCYFGVQQPDLFTKESIQQAVHQVCEYMSTNYPDARIVWATPIWRFDVEAEELEWFRELLKEQCLLYDIEVFELHLTDEFKKLSMENFGSLLEDGIHPNDMGVLWLRKEFTAYLKAEPGRAGQMKRRSILRGSVYR